MSQGSAREVSRLIVCVLGGVILSVGLLELLLLLDVVTAYDNWPDAAAAAVGLGAGLLRYGGPQRSPDVG